MSKNETCEELFLDNQICFSLYTASRLMVQKYQPLLESLDLTYPQYLTMLVLWEKDGINIGELGSRLHLDSGTLSPLLKKLEFKNLLRRERTAGDERVVRLYLTSEGQKLKNIAKEVPLTMFCSIGLEIKELQNLKSKLDSLIEKLNEE